MLGLTLLVAAQTLQGMLPCLGSIGAVLASAASLMAIQESLKHLHQSCCCPLTQLQVIVLRPPCEVPVGQTQKQQQLGTLLVLELDWHGIALARLAS